MGTGLGGTGQLVSHFLVPTMIRFCLNHAHSLRISGALQWESLAADCPDMPSAWLPDIRLEMSGIDALTYKAAVQPLLPFLAFSHSFSQPYLLAICGLSHLGQLFLPL